MSKNIFQIWKELGEKVPFGVRRDNWSNEYYTVVEKIEIKRWPYGNAYGYPTVNGKYSNHYDYSADWIKHKLIPGAGSYQWSFAPEANFGQNENIINRIPIEKSKKLNNYYKTSVFDFGKYKGKIIGDIFMDNPNYIFWCIRNIPTFYIEVPNISGLAEENDIIVPKDIIEILEGKNKFFDG